MFNTGRKKRPGRKKNHLIFVWRARIIFLIIGFVLIFPSVFFQIQSQLRKATPYEAKVSINGQVKVDRGFLGEKPIGDLPTRIIIPSLNIDLTVKEAKVISGFWEVFEDAASFGLGSAYPGSQGNTVIFAHTREGLFLNLKNIKTNEMVYVLTKDKWFNYKVENIIEVWPNQLEVIAPTPDETLTLYTCTGFGDTKRLIVTSKRLN